MAQPKKKPVKPAPGDDAPPISELFAESKVEGTFEPRADMRAVMKFTTANIGGKFGLEIEAFTNSDDAGANHIWYTIGVDSCEILDDGKGMGPKGRASFMDFARSLYRDDPTKRGHMGLDVKRFAAEYRFIEIVDASAAETDGFMRVWAFAWDDYGDRLDGNAEKQFQWGTVKRDLARIGLPADAKSGVRIRLSGRRRRGHTAAQLTEQLGGHLSPWVAEKVFVNGERLKAREISASIASTVDNHPKLGKVSVRIYIPKGGKASDIDTLRIGAMGPVMPFREFKELLTDDLYDRCPKVFSDPAVCGVIDVASFNAFVDGSRKGFDQSLFASDLAAAFVDYLQFQLADLVEQRLGTIKDEEGQKVDARLAKDLADMCRLMGDRRREPAPPEPFITLGVKDAELMPGESIEIPVRRRSEHIRDIRWDSSRSGGAIAPSPDDGVVYTAGKKIGEYELVASDAENPATKAKVRIAIVSRRRLRVKPGQITVELGESVTFRAVNAKEDTAGAEHLRWRTDEARATIVPDRGEKVVYTAGFTEGAFRVEVYDQTNPERRSAAHVVVVKDRPERPRPDRPDDTTSDTVVIETLKYKIIPAPMRSHPGLSWIIGTPRDPWIEVYLNMAHPAFTDAARRGYSAKLEVGLREVILRHIVLTHPEGDLTLEGMADLVGKLHEKIVSRLGATEEE